MAFRHVLVATDFSEASRAAFEAAVEIAHEAHAALTVVHTCEIPLYADVAAPVDLITPVTDTAERKLEELLASVRAACPGATGAVRTGVPWEQILAVAEERGADLVVVGTHGRRGLAHAFMGSVAERVVRMSSIPVLTVRAPPPPVAVATPKPERELPSAPPP